MSKIAKLLIIGLILSSFTFQANAELVLHEYLAPAFHEMKDARESLPKQLKTNECAIACYKKDKSNNYIIAGYYAIKGDYNASNICIPENDQSDISPKTSKYSKLCTTLINCKDKQCWAGGDTGGFYTTKN